MFMYDWTNLLNDVVAGAVSVAGLVGALKKWPWILKGAVYIEQHAGEIVHTVEAIAESPAGAMVKQALHHEVDKANEKLQQSEIGRLALVGLHSFGTNLANLSDTQKTSIVHFVRSNTNATEDEIRTALDDMQKVAQDFAQLPIVQAANLFTAAAKPKESASSSEGAAV
jgi:glutaredoxin 2